MVAGFVFTSQAQQSDKYSARSMQGLSPSAAMRLLQVQNGVGGDAVYAQGRACVAAFAIPSAGADEKAFGRYEVRVLDRGTLWTLLIPLDRYEELVASGLCSYLDLGYKNEVHNDRMRGQFAADYIHGGVGLPQGYDGTGVVVGVIDIGFEYGHPTFLDSTGATLRIKRVWDQQDSTGTAPAAFGYGSEYTTREEILAAEQSAFRHTHGTHVAGMAAGCGAPGEEGRAYRGVAPAADLVFVSCDMTDPGVFNAIRYIHSYARSVNKPCVINMSLGSQEGSHDGLTGLDRNIVDYLHEAGAPGEQPDSVVLVSSAGNDGSEPVHIHRHFSATDSSFSTILFSFDTADVTHAATAWGVAGDTFSVQLNILQTSSGQMLNESPIIRCVAGVDSIYTFSLPTMSGFGDYECTVAVAATNPYNQRPNVTVVAKHTGLFDINFRYALLLTLRSTSADLHVWSLTGNLLGSTDFPQLVRGDSQYAIAGVGGNSTSVISVGSYNTRQSWYMPNGRLMVSYSLTEGDVSYFSSHGPTLDGRTKPDIMAPGAQIVSSVNRLYSSYLQPNFLYDSLVWNGHTEYYALMQGTSMASPAAAGVVALWLQANPALNVDSVRTLMHSTARRDEFTGAIGPEGDNTWGWGKLNALGGLPETSVQYHTLNVRMANQYEGFVEGSGLLPEGPHTVKALPERGFFFDHWSDGSTANPYTVNLTSDTTLYAYFEIDGSCDTLETFPSELEFNSNTNCWIDIDGDGDSCSWNLMGTIAASKSCSGATDNWLLTPPISAVSGLVLKFSVSSMLAESRAVVAVSTEASEDTADYTTVLFDADLPSSLVSDPIDTLVNLDPFAGQIIRLAFRSIDANGRAYLFLENPMFELREVTGIADAESGRHMVYTRGTELCLSGVQGQRVQVYDALGRCVLSLGNAADGHYALPAAGVYTIRVGGSIHKVVAVR